MIGKALFRMKKAVVDSSVLLLDWIVPKDDKLIIFGSAGGRSFNGNPRAVFDYVLEHEKEYDPRIFLRRDVDLDTYGEDLRRRVVSDRTFADLVTRLKARTLVGAHGQADFGLATWSPRKNFIQLWHGRGTKNDGFTHDGYDAKMRRRLKRHNRLVTAFVTASKIDSGEKARTFDICDSKLHPLGYPRNDALLRGDHPGVLCRMEDLPPHEKVVLYAPTFRPYGPAEFFPFDDFSLEGLNDFLERNSILLLTRRHINDEGGQSFEGERIVELGFDVCPDVNDAFHDTDVLITDYSSIFMDFLLLERPMIFVPYDLERYSSDRGFIYGALDHWTPGPKVGTFEEFLEAIETALAGCDPYQPVRRVFNTLFNAGQGSDSSKKVFELIERLL